MSDIGKKVEGTTKEVIAEIIGDQNLQTEGRRERQQAEQQKVRKDEAPAPADNLNRLT